MASSAWAIRVGVDLDTSDIQSQLNKAAQGTKVNIDTSGATGGLQNLNKNFDVTYQMANKIYQMSKQAISSMVEEVYAVDKALTEFKKVSDLRGIGLQEYSQELAEAGQGVARTMSDMIEAATMFRKSGFNDEEAKQLATMATMFQNISDVQVSAGEAASSIVSQLQAFGRGALEPIHILDAYNKVAAEFAVGTNDLSKAMEISAAGMATYNNSFEQTIGLITSGTEIMVGRSSQVARGLNTIAANIVKNSGVLEQYGIQVKDSNGNLKSTFDVLKELKPVWDKLSDAERNSLGITLAGKNQYRVLASIMTNFEHAIEATEAALNSEGTAMAQNAAYMESLEAKTTRIKALFQELSQSIIGSDMVSGVLDLAEAFLKLANTPLGGFITQVTLLSGAVMGLYGMLQKGILGFLPALGVAAPYILAIVTAFTALYTISKAVKKELQEKADAKIFDNVATAIKESEEKIKGYDEALSDARKKLQELNSVPFEERTPEIDKEIARLEALIKGYETLKKVEEERQRTELIAQLRKTEYEHGATITPTTKMFASKDYKTTLSDIEAGYGKSIPLANQQSLLDAVTKSYGSYEEAVYGVAGAYAEFDTRMAKFMTESHSVEEIADFISKKLGLDILPVTHDWNEELDTNNKLLSEQADALENKLYNPSEKMIKETKDLIKQNKDYYDILKMLPYDELSDKEKQFIAEYEKLTNILTKATLGTSRLATAEEKLREAKKEASKTGDTLSLADYVSVLQKVQGIDFSNMEDAVNYFKALGLIDLDYTEEELQELIQKLKEVNGEEVDVEVDVETDDLEEGAEEVASKVDELNEKGITITSKSEADALVDSFQKVIDIVNEVNKLSVNIDINTNAGTVLTTFKNILSTLRSFPRSKSVSVSVTDYATETLKEIKYWLDELKDKTITVKVNKKGDYATGTDYFQGGTALINDGTPINGSAAELVVANGEASIYNDGEPTLVDLPRGAKIYTAAETQALLRNVDGLKDAIPSFADGNVTVPADINANNIIYNPSEYYQDKNYNIKKNDVEDFDKWLKKRKHLLELDLITEEQYYLDLEKMNEEYLKDNKNAQDKYWQYQEEVYKWKKQQLEAENELLEKQIELEQALGDLAKAKSSKILVFKDGHFQYMADVDAIAEAQRNVNEIKSGYASGTTHATAGVHLVGENGPELRVLNAGDGVISSNLTKNLLDIARMGTKGIGDAWNNVKETLYSFNIANLTLPNVSDADSFLDGLKSYAYQYSYS